jgi:hypothetical protein
MKKSLVTAFTAVLLSSRLLLAQELSKPPREALDRYSLGGWISLSLANHAAAAFDAATTRRSILAGNHEQDPLDKPFVNSRSLYVVTQIGPLIPDALGFWMLRNERRWMRPIWWIPQMAYTAFVSWTAFHNIRISQ